MNKTSAPKAKAASPAKPAKAAEPAKPAFVEPKRAKKKAPKAPKPPLVAKKAALTSEKPTKRLNKLGDERGMHGTPRGGRKTSVLLNAAEQPDGSWVGTDRRGKQIDVYVIEDPTWRVLTNESLYTRMTQKTKSTHRVRAAKLAMLIRDLVEPDELGEKHMPVDKDVARAIFKADADMKDGTLSTWLIGSGAPSGDNLKILADYFKVRSEWLSSEVDRKPPVYGEGRPKPFTAQAKASKVDDGRGVPPAGSDIIPIRLALSTVAVAEDQEHVEPDEVDEYIEPGEVDVKPETPKPAPEPKPAPLAKPAAPTTLNAEDDEVETLLALLAALELDLNAVAGGLISGDPPEVAVIPVTDQARKTLTNLARLGYTPAAIVAHLAETGRLKGR